MTKKLLLTAAMLLSFTTFADLITDTYNLKLSLRIPRVYNNTESQGYRKYQTQKITATMKVTYDTDDVGTCPTIEICDMINNTHKVNGSKIQYTVLVDNDGQTVIPRFNALGNNKKNEFKQASVIFHIECEPSYAKGEPNEDNSLYITLAGIGTVADRYWYSCGDEGSYLGTTKKSGACKVGVVTKLSGYVTGAQGCGCTDYGHVSPTRVMSVCGPSDVVTDVAAVYGTWSATLVLKESHQ